MMKKSEPAKNLLDARGEISPLRVIRAYFSAVLLMHRNIGALRIITAYIFIIFALFSLSYTIRLPLSSQFLPPTAWAKVESRAISVFIMIINILVYGMILNWRKGSAFSMVIRIALMGTALYLDTFLIRITYMLIRDGSFF